MALHTYTDAFAHSTYVNGSFKLVGFSEYAKAANSTVYTAKKKNSDDMNLDISGIVKY